MKIEELVKIGFEKALELGGIEFEWDGHTFQGVQSELVATDSPEIGGFLDAGGFSITARKSDFPKNKRPAVDEEIEIDGETFKVLAIATCLGDPCLRFDCGPVNP